MTLKTENSKLTEAQANVTEAERVLNLTTPLLIDRLLMATDNNIQLVTDLMADIINFGGHTANLALALRRVNATKYESEEDKELHPDSLSARQDSGLFSSDASQQTIRLLERISKPSKAN